MNIRSSRVCAPMIAATAAAVLAAASGLADTIRNQQPVPGGGVFRWSQLWQDPGPAGNDLDGDSVCWADFTLAAPAQINHMEWWGAGACELGFRVQVWNQDPGTIAYQPLGVFYYGGDPTVHPWVTFDTAAAVIGPGPGGIYHYTLDLATPISLPANDAVNPRWFVAIIGLTAQPYATWDWSQGTGGSTRSYQFIRGGTSGGGSLFRALHEGRALVLSTPFVCRPDYNADGALNTDDISDFITDYFTVPAVAGGTGVGGYAVPCAGAPTPYDTLGYKVDMNADCMVNTDDISDYITAYFQGC